MKKKTSRLFVQKPFIVFCRRKSMRYRTLNQKNHAPKQNKVIQCTCLSVRVRQKEGIYRGSNPGPLAPKARILPLDHRRRRHRPVAPIHPITLVSPAILPDIPPKRHLFSAINFLNIPITALMNMRTLPGPCFAFAPSIWCDNLRTERT